MTNSPPEPTAADLLLAMNDLSTNVGKLTAKVDISAKVARRNNSLTIGLAVFFMLVLSFGGWQFSRVTDALQTAQDAIDGNSENAIQSCVNANETRAANLALWTTVLDYVQAGGPDPSITKLQTWIALLYQPHDCNDLDREYKIPPPPSLGPNL